MQFKEFFFKISILYTIIPVHFLMKLAGKKVILPFYHFVDDGKNQLVNHLYISKTKYQFINDIQFLKKHFKSMSTKDLSVNKNSSKEYYFSLSFDDGLSNFYKVVAPILLKEKVDAINFLNSNFINNKSLFYRYKVNIILNFLENKTVTKSQQKSVNKLFNFSIFNKDELFLALKKITINNSNKLDKLAEVLEISFSDFLKNKKPYLSENQVLELIKKGFLFGAHSKSHPRYADISLDNQLIETLESVHNIKDKFNLKENYFAFPFSDDRVSTTFFDKIKLHNMITFGTSGLKDVENETHFQRIPMEHQTVYTAETIIKGELVYYILKKFFGRHKTNRS